MASVIKHTRLFVLYMSFIINVDGTNHTFTCHTSNSGIHHHYDGTNHTFTCHTSTSDIHHHYDGINHTSSIYLEDTQCIILVYLI